MKKLTIITVNLNNADGLKKTIESVISQTYANYEFIIIDGASADESVNIIKNYEDKISYWVSEKDNGIYSAMNKGIQRSSGEFLQFLNSGDLLANESVLENIFNPSPDCDLIYGNCIKVNAKGIPEPGVTFSPGAEITFGTFYRESLNHQSAFIKRSLFDKYGLYDEELKIISDWKFFITAFALNPAKAIYKDIDVVLYDMQGISSMQKKIFKAEREKVLAELIPSPILADYKNSELDNIREQIIKKHVITRKLFRLSQVILVRFSKFLDKIPVK